MGDNLDKKENMGHGSTTVQNISIAHPLFHNPPPLPGPLPSPTFQSGGQKYCVHMR